MPLPASKLRGMGVLVLIHIRVETRLIVFPWYSDIEVVDLSYQSSVRSVIKMPIHDFLPPSRWAALWLSDLGRLRDVVETLGGTPIIHGFIRNPIMIGESVLSLVCFHLLPSSL